MDPLSRCNSPLPPLFEDFSQKSGGFDFEPLTLGSGLPEDDLTLSQLPPPLPSPLPEPIDIRALGNQVFAEESGIPEEPINAEQTLDRASVQTLIATLSYLLAWDPSQKNSYAFTRACDRIKEKITLELTSDGENALKNLIEVPLQTLIEAASLFPVDTYTFRELSAAISSLLNKTPPLLALLFEQSPEYFITLIELSIYFKKNLLSRLFTLFFTHVQTISSDHFKRAVTALSKECPPDLIQSLKEAFIRCAPNILPTLTPESFTSLLELFSKKVKKDFTLYTLFSNELYRYDPTYHSPRFQRLGITKALEFAHILVQLHPEAAPSLFKSITSCYLVNEATHELELDALHADTLTCLLKFIYQPLEELVVVCPQEVSSTIIEELTASSADTPCKMEAADPTSVLQLLHLLAEKKGDHIDRLFSSFEKIHCTEDTLGEFSGEELITLSKALFEHGNKNKNIFLTIQKLLLTRNSRGRRAWKELESTTQYEALSIFGRVGAANPELLQFTNPPTREEANSCSYHAQVALFALNCDQQQQLIDKTSSTLLDLLNKNQKLPDTLLLPLYKKYIESNYLLREDLRTALQSHIIHAASDVLSGPELANLLTQGKDTSIIHGALHNFTAVQLQQILGAYSEDKIKNRDFLIAIQDEFLRTTPENNGCKLDTLSFEEQAYLMYVLQKTDVLSEGFFNKIAQPLAAENGKLEGLQPEIVAYVAIGAVYYCKNARLLHRLEEKILRSEYGEAQPLLIEMLNAYTDPRVLIINKNNYTAALADYFKENIILKECAPKLLAKAIIGFLQAPEPPAAQFLTQLRLAFMKGSGEEYSHFHVLDIEEALLLAQKMAEHKIFTKSVYDHFFKAVLLRDENNHTRLSKATYKSLSEFMSLILNKNLLPHPYAEYEKTFVSSLEEAFLRVDENGKTTLEKNTGVNSVLDTMVLFIKHRRMSGIERLWDAIASAILPYKAEGVSALVSHPMLIPYHQQYVFNRLIDQGLPVNLPFANKDTLLILAAKTNNLAGCAKLLERGAPIHKRDANGLSALDHACMNGFTEIARLLITQYHAPIDSFEKSPFQMALKAQTWELDPRRMKAFFKAFFGDFPEIIAHISTDNGEKSLIEYLREHPEILVNRSRRHRDCNPLEVAHLLQDNLVAYSIIHEIVEQMGKTQLMQYLQTLTQKYFEPYATLLPQLFCYACNEGDVPFALELLTAYPKAIHLTDADNYGYLHSMAIAYVNDEDALDLQSDILYPIAEKLLETNIDKNFVNKHGRTPLHDFCDNGIPKTTQLLLSQGADIARVNNKKQTAFQNALGSELWKKAPAHMIQFFETFFGNQPEVMRLIKEHKGNCTLEHFRRMDLEKLIANKAENPLVVPFLFQDLILAMLLIPHLTAREFERHLKDIQNRYPRLSTRLLTDAQYAVNIDTMKASEIEANIPPKVPGVALQELLLLFDEINFTKEGAENYYDPQPLYTELGVTSIAALRAALENDFIKKIEEKRVFQGTPKRGTPALDTFYNTIESAVTHIIAACKKMDNSFDNRKKKSDAIIEFLKTKGMCGARIYNVSRNQYSVIVKNKPLTLENCLTTNLGEFRSILLESLVPSRISEDNKTIYDIHDSLLLLKHFGKKFNIPHAAMFESFDDEYGTRRLNIEEIENQFYFDLYTPTAIIAELSQQFRHDEEFRTLAIDWWKRHVPASWKKEETEKLLEKAAAAAEDRGDDRDDGVGSGAVLKQFVKKNFLNVQGKVTLEAVQQAIEEDRGQEYLGEVMDMTAVPMQMKREALIEMLVILRVITVQKFRDDGAGGSGSSR